MHLTHPIGIDLGTTYSCIATLNKQGEPITLENQEGELATPSVVLFGGDHAIVGTEALNNAVSQPDRVVENAKRFMGDSECTWTISGQRYTPVHIASLVLKKLLAAAQQRLGPIEQAVITVPALFTDAQRHATIEAGHRAGLERVDLINEPVAAALCYVLGTEGLWFTELADEQRILVYDLGGGTFDLSLVRYCPNEVSVMVSTGDLNLGGIEWNRALEDLVCTRFARKYGSDPRESPESRQALAISVEKTKRSLSVRPRAALTCRHAGHQQTLQIEMTQFEKLTKSLVDRTAEITKRLISDNGLGWAHVDVVLMTGGSSRMPMIRNLLRELSGRTLNTSLSPDLTIAHGAAYYAGMLLSNDKFAKSVLSKRAGRRLAGLKQRSVNARALGILVRNSEDSGLVPRYLIPANTPLPAAGTEQFGTVVPDQRRVHLQIVESGTSPGDRVAKLGACVIDDLPAGLPEGSEIAVTISYDAEARVHVAAKDVSSGKQATTELIRRENIAGQLTSEEPFADGTSAAAVPPEPDRRRRATPSLIDADSDTTGGLVTCPECGEILDSDERCPVCRGTVPPRPPKAATRSGSPVKNAPKRNAKSARNQRRRAKKESSARGTPRDGSGKQSSDSRGRDRPGREQSPSDVELGEDEFWSLFED